MEKGLNNAFCEMTEKEMMELDGGGVVDAVSSFLANKLVWTNAKFMYNHFFVPIVPSKKGKTYTV